MGIEIYIYEHDGACFVAHAKSFSRFHRLINQKSNWGRYSKPFLKSHTSNCIFESWSKQKVSSAISMLFGCNFREGINGIWIPKYLRGQGVYRFISYELEKTNSKIVKKEELEKLKNPEIEKLKADSVYLERLFDFINSLKQERDAI